MTPSTGPSTAPKRGHEDGIDRTISALLPVHAGVQPEHLTETIVSILAQTRVPDEVVVVHDGPLSADQLSVLEELRQGHPAVVEIRLPINRGAGVANQAGLLGASGQWIAKVDADDVSVRERFETQLNAAIQRGVDVCGSAMLEFESDPQSPVSLRTGPSDHVSIGKRLRVNNPINHPTAFYRRDAALRVGGYPPWRYMQDYGLFARMYVSGARMTNLSDPLVLFRTGEQVTKRRRSSCIRRLELALQCELHRLGVISGPRMIVNVCWRNLFRILPPALLGLISRRILARKAMGSADR